MTILPSTRDLAPLAAAARSVLSCPSTVSLVVDGLDDVMAGIDAPAGGADSADGGAGLGMCDLDGRPTLSCPVGVPLARSARAGARALLTLDSGLGARGSADRDAVLTLGGALVSLGVDECGCCRETLETVVLDVDLVLLARRDSGDPVRVPVGAFSATRHRLNRGFLQRTVEHANRCHQEELRQAVSQSSRVRLVDVVGVSLAGLSPSGVDVVWVEPDGAHQRRLDFARPARTPDELGDLLREELHAGLC